LIISPSPKCAIFFIAAAFLPFAVINIQSLSSPTLIGESLFTKVPSPNCPWSFSPHVHREPSVLIAIEKLSPVEIAFQH
jgi:hypothetical protein